MRRWMVVHHVERPAVFLGRAIAEAGSDPIVARRWTKRGAVRAARSLSAGGGVYSVVKFLPA